MNILPQPTHCFDELDRTTDIELDPVKSKVSPSSTVPGKYNDKQEEKHKTNKIYDTIVLSGGGQKGFATLGAIHGFIQKKILDMNQITTWIGCSSGFMCCYLLAIGYQPVEIISYLIKHRIFEQFQPKLDRQSLTQLWSLQGMYSFRIISDCFEAMTLEKVGHYLTLGQVKKEFNKVLICTTFNFTRNCIEYLTPETHPDLPCMVAIRMTCNIPLVFNRFEYDRQYYIDGGITNNFPMEMIQDRVKNYAMGIYLYNNDINQNTDTLVSYFLRILYILFHENVLKSVREYKNHPQCTLIPIQIPDAPLQIHFSHTQLLDMFSHGYREIYSHSTRE